MQVKLDKGWLPDFLDFNMPDGGLLRCENLLPYDEYYSPAKSTIARSGSAVSGVLRKAKEFRASTGVDYTIIGTSTKLYRMEVNNSLTEVTRASGGAYATGENNWDMVQYGDWIIATDYVDVPQVLKTFASGTNFAALAGSPPNAKYALIYHGHLILGYTYESAVAYPRRLWISAHEAPETWTPSLTTGAGYQDLEDADGDMTGLATIGTSVGIFFSNSITIGDYCGAPGVLNYQINRFRNVGALPGTIIPVGDQVYFWSKYDFHTCNASQIQSIGTGIYNTVLSELNQTYLYRITTHHDQRRGLIMWAYPSTTSTGNPDRILVYNYRNGRYTYLKVDVGCIFPIHTAAVLADSLDAVFPNADLVPYYADSNIWSSGVMETGCLTTTGYVGTFSGPALTGVIETAGIKDGSNSNIVVSMVRPQISGIGTSTVSARLGRKWSDSADRAYTASAAMDTKGRCKVRAMGKLVTIELTTASHAGIAPYIEAEIVQVGSI